MIWDRYRTPLEGRDEAKANALPCWCGSEPDWNESGVHTEFGCLKHPKGDRLVRMTVINNGIHESKSPRALVEKWNRKVRRHIEAENGAKDRLRRTHCGVLNPVGARFCAICATPLAEGEKDEC